MKKTLQKINTAIGYSIGIGIMILLMLAVIATAKILMNFIIS